jgi:8-oxo-dGTP pyrophosphatase MutT (NUDIX family)
MYQCSYQWQRARAGAVLLSADRRYVLLVQHYDNYFWGFPQGKIEYGESVHKCAIREVFEETGYDIQGKMNINVFIESCIRHRRTRLYIICNVSMREIFIPKVSNEIAFCKWFRLDSYIRLSHCASIMLGQIKEFLLTDTSIFRNKIWYLPNVPLMQSLFWSSRPFGELSIHLKSDK